MTLLCLNSEYDEAKNQNVPTYEIISCINKYIFRLINKIIKFIFNLVYIVLYVYVLSALSISVYYGGIRYATVIASVRTSMCTVAYAKKVKTYKQATLKV